VSRLVRVATLAVALLLAVLLVPDIQVAWGDEAASIGLAVLALALLFGVINGFIRPIARLVSLPLNIATLGMFSVVLNAALLLLVALIVDLATEPPLIVIGGYPPDLGIEAVVTAAVGSFIISGISTVLTVLIPDT
jgi:putative membrane protein